jgi:hypothetical protein
MRSVRFVASRIDGCHAKNGEWKALWRCCDLAVVAASATVGIVALTLGRQTLE